MFNLEARRYSEKVVIVKVKLYFSSTGKGQIFSRREKPVIRMCHFCTTNWINRREKMRFLSQMSLSKKEILKTRNFHVKVHIQKLEIW